MEIVWDHVTEGAWRAGLPDESAALQQSWHYGAAVEALGRGVHRAALFRHGNQVALAQIITRPLARFAQVGLL